VLHSLYLLFFSQSRVFAFNFYHLLFRLVASSIFCLCLRFLHVLSSIVNDLFFLYKDFLWCYILCLFSSSLSLFSIVNVDNLVLIVPIFHRYSVFSQFRVRTLLVCFFVCLFSLLISLFSTVCIGNFVPIVPSCFSIFVILIFSILGLAFYVHVGPGNLGILLVSLYFVCLILGNFILCHFELLHTSSTE
jgi:hypothetical protein